MFYPGSPVSIHARDYYSDAAFHEQTGTNENNICTEGSRISCQRCQMPIIAKLAVTPVTNIFCISFLFSPIFFVLNRFTLLCRLPESGLRLPEQRLRDDEPHPEGDRHEGTVARWL